MSASRSRRREFLGRLLLLFPWGFQMRTCLVMLDEDFRRVWPIHFQRLWKMSSFIGCCFVRFHRSWLLMMSDDVCLETRSGRHFGSTRMSRMDMDRTIHPGREGGFLKTLFYWTGGHSWTKFGPIVLSSLFPLYPVNYCLVFPFSFLICSC